MTAASERRSRRDLAANRLYTAEIRDLLDRMSSHVANLAEGGDNTVDHLLRDVSILKDKAAGREFGEIAELCRGMLWCLSAFHNLSQQERAEAVAIIHRSCGIIYDHTAAIGDQEPPPSVPSELTDQLRGYSMESSRDVPESQSRIRPLYDAKGVLAFQLPGAIKIRLPTAGTSEAADTVMAALDEIWRLTPQDSGWIIEMGGVAQLHHRVIGHLLVRELGLESQQRRLELVGIRPELLMNLHLGGESIHP